MGDAGIQRGLGERHLGNQKESGALMGTLGDLALGYLALGGLAIDGFAALYLMILHLVK